MKKLIALLLSLVMLLSLLAGCGAEETKPAVNSGGKVTLTIGVPKSTLVEDYDTNYYTLWLEEQTGFNLEFQEFAAATNDYKTQLSAMVAGGMKLPDILYGFSLGADLYERYGQDGVFVDLAPYFNNKELSARWWERFELLDQDFQDNNWRRMQSADEEGHIYAFPEIQESMIDIMNWQVWINQEWLDALNLQMPTDNESLYNVLKAFKEGDPNGNGVADEIPLVGTSDGLSGQTLDWLINLFIYETDDTYFNVDENGKLYSPYTTDEYRQALSFIRKLYVEGLMSPLVLTASHNDLRSMVCPSEGGFQTAGVVCTHLTTGFVMDHAGILAYEPLPMWGNCIFHENRHNFTTFITKDCQNLDAAWELLMCMSTEESALIQRYGEKGVSWDWAQEGSTSVMGTQAQIRLYQDTWSTIGNDNWRNIEATILINAEGEGNQAVPEEETPVRQHKYDLFNEALDNYYHQIENFNPPQEQICPLLVWSNTYKEEVPYARDDCKQYIEKARTDFITGLEDINNDADWQKYLDTLNDRGFEQWLYYSQVIYDETMQAQS